MQIDKEVEITNEIKKSKDVVKRRLSRIESVDKIVNGIKKIQEELENDEFNKIQPNELLQMNIRLTGHLFFIGTLAAEASMEANMAYSYKKFDYNRQWKFRKQELAKAFKKTTNADVESEIGVSQWKDAKREIEKKYYADTLIFYTEFINTLINTIKDRIKHLEGEAKRGQYQES